MRLPGATATAGARHGVVYTPADVTAPMVARAIDPLVAGRRGDDIAALRVCDPAIGKGAFALAAIARLAEHMRAAGATADEANRRAVGCMVGVDVDARAIAAARAAIAAEFGAAPAADQLVVADALTLAWPRAFAGAFARGGFDAVVGNPPYVRQELLAAAKPSLRGFAAFDAAADLYVYFVELAHRIVRPRGRWCLVMPSKWLTADYGRPLRRFLATAGAIEGVVDFSAGPRLFADADAFPCIAWGERDTRAPLRVGRARAPVIADALADSQLAAIDRAALADHPWHLDDADDRARIAELEARWPPLAQLLPSPPARGIVTGCNRAFVVDDATRAQLIAADPACAAWVAPFVRGRDVRRWSLAPIARYLLAVPHGTPLASLPPPIHAHLARFRDELEPRPDDHAPRAGAGAWRGRKPGRYRWHELQDPIGALAAARTPRLLVQDIQSAPACCLAADGARFADTTVWIIPSADRVLLAILNSSLYGWYARRRFPPALGGAVRPKRAYLLRLPIAQPSPPLRARIEQLVDAQLIAPTADRDAELDAAVDRAYAASRPSA